MSKTSSIRCLITAGPTREFFDPVRFISNPSTGKMGYALAQAALNLDWSVDLVSGPVSLKEPDGAILYPVVSAEEMFNQVDALFDVCDVFIMSAAVSDFKPLEYAHNKVKKQQAERSILLAQTIDILKTMAQRKQTQFIVGFAAETENLEVHAKEKLANKSCDWIVANKIGEEGIGFGADDNIVTLFRRDGSDDTYGPSSKIELAKKIIDLVDKAIAE